MDSNLKSSVFGRLAGPIFHIISVIIFLKWGIKIDAETQALGVDLVGTLIAGLAQIWALAMPVWSKIKQKREGKECN